MKRTRSVMWGAVLLLTCATAVWSQQNANGAASPATGSTSQLPRLVRFSGTLKDVNGNPLSGVIGATFLLYTEQNGGVPLWLETQNVQSDKNGHYTVMLGSTKADGLPVDLFTSEQAQWLGVQAQGQAEQARVLLLSVPYALKAGDAETVGGLPPSAFVLAAPLSSLPSSGGASPTSNSPPPSTSGSVPPPASSDVTTTGGTLNTIPMFTAATNVQNSILTQTGATAINVLGKLNLPALGTAAAGAGFNSRPLDFVASVFSSTTSTAVAQTFQWQAEPVNNDRSTATGTLNLLYGAGTATPGETGLRISNKGIFTFATGQAFPGTGTITGITTANGSGLIGGNTKGTLNLALKTCGVNQVLQFVSGAWTCSNAGTGTITGVIAGTDLTGGGPSGNVTLNVDTTKIPQLGAANTFTGNQTITGNLNDTGNISATGSISGQTGSFSGNNSSQIVNVTQSGVGNAIRATSTTTGVYGSGNSYGVAGASVATSGTGIYGSATGASGTGVLGSELANSGTTYGVLGSSSSQSGYGVYGIGGGGPGGGAGVYGIGNYGVEGVSAASGGRAVYGVSTASDFGYGVIGLSGGDTSLGVLGSSTGTASYGVVGNGAIGVNGSSNAARGTGVLGEAPGSGFSVTGSHLEGEGSVGVWGDTVSNGGFGTGLLGTSDENYAVFANNNSSSSATILSENDTTTFNAEGDVFFAWMPHLLGGASAIMGDPGCATGFMGLQLGQGGMSNCNNYTLLGDISGNTYVNALTNQTIHLRINNNDQLKITNGYVDVLGILNKGGGSFKIDHPLDPANKYLYHSFVESPDMKNMYDGNITTDGAGLATVTLPDWFETLNRDFRYQLTVIGQFAQAIVASEISGNQFSIRTDKPTVKVSWQVTGTRQDAFANAHRIQVEVEKAPADRGHYLYPELVGAPETERIGYMAVPGGEQVVRHRREMLRRGNAAPLPQRTPLSIPTPRMPAPPNPTPPLHSLLPAAQGNKSQLNQR
jgi:trimeric autotransporter adhesin